MVQIIEISTIENIREDNLYELILNWIINYKTELKILFENLLNNLF